MHGTQEDHRFNLLRYEINGAMTVAFSALCGLSVYLALIFAFPDSGAVRIAAGLGLSAAWGSFFIGFKFVVGKRPIPIKEPV